MKSQLITKILDSIPPHIKPINYLMDMLDIGRESAYRRVRGEIPFTFEEISKLSLELGFSVDEVISKNKINRTFLDLLTSHSSPDEAFLQMLRNYYGFIEHIEKKDNAEILASQNRVPLSLFIDNDILFKFYYYKFTYQADNDRMNHTFSDTVIPSDIVLLRQKFISRLQYVSSYVFIMSRRIFLTICREMQYYYSRKLITDEEIILLKAALTELLEKLQNIILKGCNDIGIRYYIYLSFLEIDANNACISYGDNAMSEFWIYSSNFIDIRNQEVCTMHKKWFESMKKYSVLISRSNEIFQARFFEQQREYIENITNDFLFFE
jgi:hypothetical protein